MPAVMATWRPVPERKQKDEPGALFDCYNAMVTRQQELMDEVNIQQLLREQTQLNSTDCP